MIGMKMATGTVGAAMALAWAAWIAAAAPSCACARKPAADPGRDGGAASYAKAGGKFYRDEAGRLFIRTSGVLPDDPGRLGEPFYRRVPDIDVATYDDLGGEFYSKDRNAVYVEMAMSDGDHIGVLEHADAATFRVFGYRWGKDKDHDEIVGADPASFSFATDPESGAITGRDKDWIYDVGTWTEGEGCRKTPAR